jgi:hypothetical protein
MATAMLHGYGLCAERGRASDTGCGGRAVFLCCVVKSNAAVVFAFDFGTAVRLHGVGSRTYTRA